MHIVFLSINNYSISYAIKKRINTCKTVFSFHKKGGEEMKGALVFLAAFVIFLLITLATPSLPPGEDIYYGIGAVETDFEILGIEVPTLVSACFNGIVYGI